MVLIIIVFLMLAATFARQPRKSVRQYAGLALSVLVAVNASDALPHLASLPFSLFAALALLLLWHAVTRPTTHTRDANPVDMIAERLGVDHDPHGWRGWRTVTHDDSPTLPDQRLVLPPVDSTRVNGVPGRGLADSPYTADRSSAGVEGERLLHDLALAGRTDVESWWSLHGLDADGTPTDADIDAVFAGRHEGRTILWFVDAKRYQGGTDTVYENVDEHTLIRIAPRLHAFETGADGTPLLPLSDNMCVQRDRWTHMLAEFDVETHWLVVLTPGPKGTPDTTHAVWPGNIRAVDVDAFTRMLDDAHLDADATIDPSVAGLLDRMLKR